MPAAEALPRLRFSTIVLAARAWTHQRWVFRESCWLWRAEANPAKQESAAFGKEASGSITPYCPGNLHEVNLSFHGE